MIIQMLNKVDFWEHVEAENPLSFKKFSDYIDDFKKSTNWKQLFNETGNNDCGNGSCGWPENYAPKFHDLPFAMQRGIIENFFILENIQFYPVIHPFDESKWTFHTIDTASGEIWTQFKSSTHEELAEYTTAEEASIAAIRMSFEILNKNYIKNLN